MDANPFASLEPLEALIDKCVHCGFCLSTCPSYVLLGREMDSPRGRIYLMKAGSENRVPLTAAVVSHFDTCLGCMACETACPSGVRYAPLIEQTRATIETAYPRPAAETIFRDLLFLLLPYPFRLRLMAAPLKLAQLLGRSPWLQSILPRRIRALLAVAPSATLSEMMEEVPERTPAVGPSRLRVGLVLGCVQRTFFGRVNQATARVLAAEGCEVLAPSRQGCCGALALHAGRLDDARTFARELIRTFEQMPVEQVVVNAAGCGSAMKEYGHLLKDDATWADRAAAFSAKVRDVTETLAGLGEARATRHTMPLRVVYHDACHLAHAQGVRREPRAVLEAIPDLSLVPVAESEVCCGSAGIFNLVQPEMGAELGQRKVEHIRRVAPDAVVTSNPGCMLQIAASARESGESIPVFHVVELLDASLNNADARTWLKGRS